MRAASAGRGKRLAARPGSFFLATVQHQLQGRRLQEQRMNRRVAFREGHTVSPGGEDATAARPPPPNLRKVRLGIALVCCLKVELLGSANFLPSGELLSPRCQCECPSCAEMARAAFFVARA